MSEERLKEIERTSGEFNRENELISGIRRLRQMGLALLEEWVEQRRTMDHTPGLTDESGTTESEYLLRKAEWEQ